MTTKTWDDYLLAKRAIGPGARARLSVDTGIPETTLSRILNGRMMPGEVHEPKLATAFGISVARVRSVSAATVTEASKRPRAARRK